jgi:hypothetical protein
MRILPLLALLPLAACSYHSGDSQPVVPGTGSGPTRSFAVAGFTGVSLRGADDVDVKVGPAFSVSAEGPSAELDQLSIRRNGDTLEVGRKNGVFHWGDRDRATVKVHVTMPRLVSAEIAGAGDLAIDRTDGPTFEGVNAGAGKLSVGSLAVSQAKVSLAGAGDISLAGKVNHLTVSLVGAGNVLAQGLKASAAKVSLAGAGDVRAEVDGPASVSVVGSGTVDLGKGAKCDTSKIGAGEVHCG